VRLHGALGLHGHDRVAGVRPVAAERRILGEREVVEQLKDILSRFLETSGLSRRTAESRLLEVWRQALGEQSRHTALEGIRKNVASFRVDNAALLSELNNFRKLELLSLLQSEVREVFIRDITFRPGRVGKG